MTPKIQIDPPQQICHRPFVIRKVIVLSAVALATAGGVFFGNFVLGIVLYFGLVTLFDGLSHYALHLKSSDFSALESLLKSERVTGEELDTYFDTRRNIRLISFGLACFALGEALIFSILPLEAFCIAYVFSTVCGILYVRFCLKIVRPRLIYRDDRYYFPRPLPRPGYITVEQYALRSVGINFYGPVDI